MFTVLSGKDKWTDLTYEKMRLMEALYRGLRQSYTIIYPDGYKIICEITKE
jgi:hypothetical protein